MQTRTLGGQLDRADAGSWQIADGSDQAVTCGRHVPRTEVTSVDKFRALSAAESCSWSPNRSPAAAHLKTGTGTQCAELTKESAHNQLSVVGACAAVPGPVDML